MNGHDLKQLQTRRDKLSSELARLDVEKRDASRAHAECERKLKAIEAEIASYAKTPVVSEHAMLRYIEREMGVDLEVIKNNILTDDLKGLIKLLGDGNYPLGGHRAIVKNGVIVSIA